MGKDLQSECQKHRSCEEGRKESEKSTVVLYAVCNLPLHHTSMDPWKRRTDEVHRKPKHDRGSVEGVVEEYLKRRRLIRSGALGTRTPNTSVKNPSSARSGVKAR